MLHFLTDEHVSPAVADAARRRCPRIQITPLRDWQHGHLLASTDELLLQEAHRHGLTLVTFDLRTLPPLLRLWGEQEIEHGGVILVDDQTIDPTDVGALAQALCELWESQARVDWTNRVVFLKRAT